VRDSRQGSADWRWRSSGGEREKNQIRRDASEEESVEGKIMGGENVK
jgi:hypothetical protein